MQLQELWDRDLKFIEIGVQRADLALALRHAGYAKYLGVSASERRVTKLQAASRELADQFTCSRRRKLVLNNNADVLILSGRRPLAVWSYRSVRHAKWVVWRAGFSLFGLLALFGCVVQLLSKRYSQPQVVSLELPGGKVRRVFVTRVLRQKECRHKARHFIPHGPGLKGLFRQFQQQGVRYAVLRWFEKLPALEPDEDVDLLVDDASLEKVLKIFYTLPGILPCDLYSASGLARSSYCGTPYYPPAVAEKILAGAVRHSGICMVPNPSHYFHSLAYHAVYHKGAKSHLGARGTGLKAKGKPEHDYAGILRGMSRRLGIDVEISLPGLHEYLQRTGWGPSPEMLVRLAEASKSNRWLAMLARNQERHLRDEGLAVFVIRQESVRRGFGDEIIRRIAAGGFEILTTHTLSANEIEFAAARSRGGNWEAGEPFDVPAGPPAIAVIAYDRQPLPLSRKQRRRFTHRTNARIFVKEAIRDWVNAQQPKGESFNALHSSDNAPEAWHLIEVLAPQKLEDVRQQLRAIYDGATPTGELRRAA